LWSCKRDLILFCMGYTKIVQYGNITEIFEYEKEIKPRVGQSHLRHLRLLQRVGSIPTEGSSVSSSESLASKRKKERNKNKICQRSSFSIRRAKKSFFRLCHENNLSAKSIHFLTLTFADDFKYSECLSSVNDFFKKLRAHVISREIYQEISYIGVPELTKKGRYHFHLLLYDLPTEIAGDTISVRRYNRRKQKWEVVYATTERFTRNLQRLYGKGYLDIRPALSVSSGIAGYMSKYMGKFLANPTNEARRAYNCSRNIKKIRSHASNSLALDKEIFIPDQLAERVVSYDVPFLGTCKFSRYLVLS